MTHKFLFQLSSWATLKLWTKRTCKSIEVRPVSSRIFLLLTITYPAAPLPPTKKQVPKLNDYRFRISNEMLSRNKSKSEQCYLELLHIRQNFFWFASNLNSPPTPGFSYQKEINLIWKTKPSINTGRFRIAHHEY